MCLLPGEWALPEHSWSWLLFTSATDCIARLHTMTLGTFCAYEY